MHFEEPELENINTPNNKGKLLGVIVLTDNRQHNTTTHKETPNYHSSGTKQTEVDPFEFPSQLSNDENLIAQLTRRVILLEERVSTLSKNEALTNESGESQLERLKKKNRRKFKELVRDQEVFDDGCSVDIVRRCMVLRHP